MQTYAYRNAGIRDQIIADARPFLLQDTEITGSDGFVPNEYLISVMGDAFSPINLFEKVYLPQLITLLRAAGASYDSASAAEQVTLLNLLCEHDSKFTMKSAKNAMELVVAYRNEMHNVRSAHTKGRHPSYGAMLRVTNIPTFHTYDEDHHNAVVACYEREVAQFINRFPGLGNSQATNFQQRYFKRLLVLIMQSRAVGYAEASPSGAAKDVTKIWINETNPYRRMVKKMNQLSAASHMPF